MISFIICCFTIIIFIISKFVWNINKEKVIKLFSTIKKAYIEFWKAESKFEKYFNRFAILVLVFIIGIISYRSMWREYGSIFSIKVLVSSIIMYLIFGLLALIGRKFDIYIKNIKNIKASNKLTLSFMCTVVYYTFLILLKDEIVKAVYNFIFLGLIINYAVNIDLLLNIIKNPQYLSGEENAKENISENKEILKSMWIGATILLCSIIVNLFLGTLTIYSANNQAYLSSIQ